MRHSLVPLSLLLLWGCKVPPPADPPPAGQVVVVHNGIGTGEVRTSLVKEGCGLDCPELFGKGAAMRLVGHPSPGSKFDGFSGPCSGRMPCIVPLDKPRFVAATFSDAEARYLLPAGEGRGAVPMHGFALDLGEGLAIVGGNAPWLFRYDHDGKKLWEMDGGELAAKGVALDKDGALYVIGRDSNGAVVKKLGPGGGAEWTVAIKGSANPSDIVITPDGDALVLGTFVGAISAGKAHLESAGGRDVFAFLYSSTGSLREKLHLGEKLDDVHPRAAIQPDGSIYLSYVRGMADSMGDIAVGEAHLLRYAKMGELSWEKQIEGNARISALAVQAKDKVLLAGQFEKTATVFGKSLHAEGETDAFLASVDRSGDANFAQSFGGKNSDEATGIAVSPTGNIAIIGTFQHEMPVGQTTLLCKQYPQVWNNEKTFPWRGVDVFVAILSPEGAPLYAKAFGGSGTDFAGSIAWAFGDDLIFLMEQERLVVSQDGGIASIRDRMVIRRPGTASREGH